MHARFPNHFWHIDVFKALKDVTECDVLFIISIDGCLLSIKASVLRTKYVMSDSLIRLKNCALNKLVILQLAVWVFACMDEFDDHLCVVVKMGFVVIINFDLALGVLKSANIDSSSTCILLQEVDKVGQVVCQVLRLLQLLEEVSLVFFFLFCSLDFLLCSSFVEGNSLTMLSFLVCDCFKVGFPLHMKI